MFEWTPAKRVHTRTAALRLEWETLRGRLNSAQVSVQVLLEDAVTKEYDRLISENGPISRMSEKEKGKQADRFRQLAQSCGSSNVGKSLALSVIAIHLQALKMRDNDAASVAAETADFIFKAFEARNAV